MGRRTHNWSATGLFFVCAFTPAVFAADPPKDLEVATLTSGQLTVCTYGGFAPVSYKDANGALVGYDISFLEQFARSLNLSLSVRDYPFDGLWTLPASGRCDVAAAGIMKREDRSVGAGGAWSDAYFTVQRSLLVRATDLADFRDPKAIRDKVIVVTRGSTAEIDAKLRYPESKIEYVDEIVPDEHSDNVQLFVVQSLLAKKRIDAFEEGDVSNEYLQKKFNNSVAGGLAVADVHHIEGGRETFNFIVRTESTGIREALNAFIEDKGNTYGLTP
jgi:ABC-type amino acid transport substrate-binding protein